MLCVLLGERGIQLTRKGEGGWGGRRGEGGELRGGGRRRGEGGKKEGKRRGEGGKKEGKRRREGGKKEGKRRGVYGTFFRYLNTVPSRNTASLSTTKE